MQEFRFVEGVWLHRKSFPEKTFFTSYVRNMFWATILYKYHDTTLGLKKTGSKKLIKFWFLRPFRIFNRLFWSIFTPIMLLMVAQNMLRTYDVKQVFSEFSDLTSLSMKPNAFNKSRSLIFYNVRIVKWTTIL